MRLAPRLIQAMEILQLPMMALQERIEAEMEANPVLEMRDSGNEASLTPDASEVPLEQPDRGERALVVGEGGNGDDFQRLAELQTEYDGEFFEGEGAPRARITPGERDRKLDAMANAPAASQSLVDYLLEQWLFVEAPEPIKAAGRAIISNIDDDGYLRLAMDELATHATSDAPPAQSADTDESTGPAQAVSIDDLKQALKLVQAMDPPGVGARDLKECLLLQLNIQAAAGQDVTLERDLVRNFLRDIEGNRLPAIARRTGRSVEEIKAALASLAKLKPRPGRAIGPTSSPVVVPDAIVEVDDDGQLVITMTRGNYPRLHISRDYRKMAKQRTVDREARQFIRNNIRSAQWLMGAIEQRRDTVRRVIEEVFAVQREFLNVGAEALRPLPMVDVADKVGVHVATVSRAVSGKYVQTPQGIVPLRMFFSGGTTNAGGQDVAWDAVKAKLKELVDAEDKRKPLNDDELVEALVKNGLTIARRTVAKYRDILEIPPARKRKQF